MNKHVFIVNGKPTSGKTTFENLVLEKISGIKYSIIDPVKTLLSEAGIWDKEDKSEAARKLLSDTKILLDEYCDYSYKETSKLIKDFLDNKIDGNILFVDMREVYDIERAVKDFNATTIYIDNKNVASIITNIGDKHADSKDNYPYDLIVDNSSDLFSFKEKANSFADVLITCGGCNEKY